MIITCPCRVPLLQILLRPRQPPNPVFPACHADCAPHRRREGQISREDKAEKCLTNYKPVSRQRVAYY